MDENTVENNNKIKQKVKTTSGHLQTSRRTSHLDLGVQDNRTLIKYVVPIEVTLTFCHEGALAIQSNHIISYYIISIQSPYRLLEFEFFLIVFPGVENTSQLSSCSQGGRDTFYGDPKELLMRN